MHAYLSFNGNCAEAMAFYAQCLGGKVTMSMTYGDAPPEMRGDASMSKKIMHSQLEAPGGVLMAADVPPGQGGGQFSGASVMTTPGDIQRAQAVFNALAAGGSVMMPFGPTFWAKGFGVLTDKYGVSWMVNCE